MNEISELLMAKKMLFFIFVTFQKTRFQDSENLI